MKTGGLKRYVLRFRGEGAKPSADMDLLRSCDGLKLIDESSRRMVLVESLPEQVESLREKMSNWLIVEETFTPPPDTRAKIE